MSRFCYLARFGLLAAAGVFPVVAQAAGTAAGVDIRNSASVSYVDPWGTAGAATSNEVILRVNEVLDVTLAPNASGNQAVLTPASGSVLSFTLTNTGNGSERYVLTLDSAVTGDSFDPTNVRLYLDSNDNDLYDPATDTLHVPGSNDPVLAASASLTLFVVADIPGGLSNGNTGLVRLAAESLTARTTPAADATATVFAGQGDSGTDALVGYTGADALGEGGFVVSLVAATYTKSATVLDPFGGTNPIPEAVVTYSLVFDVTGIGDLTGAVISDPIPAGTTYVAGSLTLDGATLSDGDDGDSGSFTGSQVEVDLGDVTAPTTHTVTFKVTINP
jgi:uncharacterized repeat protein (TIGR01451 family)